MFSTIAAEQVEPGMSLIVEWAHGREACVLVREVVEDEDGTIGFDVERFGMLTGYRREEMVNVDH